MSGGTISHYQVLGLLDREEIGTVYRARDHRDGGLVALEVLPAPPDPEAIGKLRQDARAAVALDHPHISAALEIGETADGEVFVARALADGEPLGNRIDRGPLPPEQAVGLASQVAAALGRAHDQGIVHRNLRPANILMTADGQARVAGFGLAWLVGGGPSGLAYRAPEQLRGDPVDSRADVWSLGVVLYEMLTGRLPFRGPDRDALARAILERDPVPVAAINPGVPAELGEAVRLALAKAAAERPAMDDLLVALRGILAGGELAHAEATVVQVPGTGRAARPEPEPEPAPAPAAPKSAEGSRPGTGAEPSDLDGWRIAHYRILDTLGGGAMGTVYKAEDTRLRRTVAIKLLPPDLTRDPVSKARFLQEAQAASALDHANICTIHEVGETEDGQLYLAMAAYDGETVKAKIARGRLPVSEAVEIARQTASGLAKAHREGIVHRDIKPANLVVTSDGVVKIVDFGVAKLRGTSDGLSLAGSFLGTPSYMSPEQARGEEVDPRADVWSLGVMLYEMLAGSRPFRGGEDLRAVLHSLLKDRPAPLRRSRPEVPAELARIVDRMLAKSPAERYPSAAEALADLTALQGAMSAISAISATSAAGQAPPRRRVPPAVAAALAVAALLLLGLGVYPVLRRQGSAGPVQASFTRLTDQEGREIYPSLAPDGGSFVYAKAVDGQMDLFLKQSGTAPVNLTAGSPADDTQPAFSPNGDRIAFRSERDGGGIYIVSADGGTARRVADVGYNPAWSPDGLYLAVATEGVVDPSTRKADSEILRIEVATGRPTVLVRDDGVQPSWSPRGERIAYWGLPKDSARRILWTVPAAGGTPRKVLDDGYLNWNPVWSPDGGHLYFGSDRSGSLNLWRLPIDERSGEVLGEPQAVTTPSMASGFWSLSQDGRRILYAANESKSNLGRYPIDPASLRVLGPEVAVTRGSHLIRSCDISPDGRWIAFHAAQPWEDLFVIRSDGSGIRRLTDDRHKDRHPFWSPDGKRLLFYSNRDGNYEPWIFPLDGNQPERVLPEGGLPVTFPIWSRDGQRLACTYGEQAAMIDLSEPLNVRHAVPLPAADPERFYPTAWSPDGTRLAGNVARLDGSMLDGIGAYFFSSRTYQRWTSRGATPVWLHDGRRLLYIEGGRIHVFDTVTLQAREILAPPPSSIYTALSTSPDDRTLFAVRAVDEGDVWLLTLSEEEGS